MSPSRDFDAARAELLRGAEPVSFTLGGETFVCRPVVPMGDIWRGGIKAPERFTADQPGGRIFLQFSEQVALFLAPKDRDRFWSIFDDPEGEVIGAELITIVNWLTEVYTGRPQSPSTASPSGLPAVTGSPSSSTPDSDSAASTT